MKLLLADDVQEREAKAAVQCVGCDITDCQLWVLENQHDSELITQLCEEFDESYGKYSDKISNMCFILLLSI